MSEIWQRIWHFDLRLAPLTLAMSLVIIPTALRQRHKFYYVPIYFPFLPLRELNADLATYLGEDYWLGSDPEESDAEALRRKILISSLVSITIAGVLIPAFAGLGSSLFLEERLLPQFIALFVLYTLIKVLLAIRDFSQHAVASRRNTAVLGVVYFFYIGVAAQMIAAAYGWARPFVLERDWDGLLLASARLLFSTVMIQVLFLAALTTIAVSLVMDRRIRSANMAAHKERYSDTQGQG